MKKTKNKMGNKVTYIQLEPKIATLIELTCTGDFPEPLRKLTRHVGRGKTRQAAFDNLKAIARLAGLPAFTRADNGTICCGTIEIAFITKNKTRLNPVFFSQRNGVHKAFLYYPDF